MKKKPMHPKWMSIFEKYKGRKISLPDIAILKFLWKWKLATSAVLFDQVGDGQKVNGFNKRIKKLERNKMIVSHIDLMSGFWTWELADFGFYTIRESLGAIKDHGFRSASHNHDRLVQVFQLGDWKSEITAHPERSPIHTTEQELLRYPHDYLPSWVPDPKFHRPDGYTRFELGGKPSIIAVEVELHAKALSRYHDAIRWYQLMKELGRVHWLVGEPLVEKQILKAIKEVRETSSNYHVFVSLEDFETKGWDAIVRNERSENLCTLRESMRGRTGLARGEYAATQGTGRRGDNQFDKRKFVGIQGT